LCDSTNKTLIQILKRQLNPTIRISTRNW
jgi:hypothetical protein